MRVSVEPLATTAEVEYRVLGSLEALRADRSLPLGGAKQRTVLAVLLLNANRVVTSDELIEALWPQKAPGKPQTAIQGYVSELRRILDADRPFEVIVTEPAGYRIPVAPEAFDLFRLETLLKRGRDALVNGAAVKAADALGEALALFRGPPLADFTYESWAQPEIGRLVELRLACLEDRIEADLRLGRHGELVGEIEPLVAEHPLREGLRGHLILALYRSARQSEALAAYQDARTALVEEFGIEPTRALQELERRILLQDPSLDLEPAAQRATSSGGVLTLLFTDIEGSTRLLHRLGDEYAHVLLEHRRLLRDAFEGRSGRIVDNYGDCFFAAFERPVDAAAAAVAAQRALAEYPWPDRVPVRVRIGVHIGEPVAVGDGFVGVDVHRAARICDAAHGGQVLLSGDTVEALGDELPEGMDARDLAEHVLRDLPHPERLFQLVAPGLPAEFPPPRGERGASAPRPDRSILVVPGDGAAVSDLVEAVAPLSSSPAPHELIVAQLIDVSDRSAGRLDEALARTTSELEELRADLAERALAVRVAAFTSQAIGQDIVRLASEQAVDLAVLGCSRERLRAGVLDLALSDALTSAPCDVALCVLGDASPSADGIVLVPFGGGPHDWAALELGAWFAAASGWRLRLLGVTGGPDSGQRDASRLLAAASLAVQQLVGVASEPVLMPASAGSLVGASQDAALVVVAVPDDWDGRGLGSVRAELVGAGQATTLVVRRGRRPGGLAPREGQTRFTWSISEVVATP